jgi:hypothetical protein
VLVFGLHAEDDAAAALRPLMGRAAPSRIELCLLPGAGEQAYAVLHLASDPVAAWRLADELRRRSLHGHRLQTWVPAMPWR